MYCLLVQAQCFRKPRNLRPSILVLNVIKYKIKTCMQAYKIEIIITIKQSGLQFMTSLKTEASEECFYINNFVIHCCKQKKQFHATTARYLHLSITLYFLPSLKKVRKKEKNTAHCIRFNICVHLTIMLFFCLQIRVGHNSEFNDWLTFNS